jgi:hypothetical protein
MEQRFTVSNPTLDDLRALVRETEGWDGKHSVFATDDGAEPGSEQIDDFRLSVAQDVE